VRTAAHPIAATVILIVSSGCGGEAGVSGIVSLDGKPLPGVHLVFFPKDADSRTARLFVADADDQGRFSVGAIGSPQGGIPPGSYRLSLTTAYSVTASDDEPPLPERVPAAYREGVDFNVPAGGIQNAAVDLKSK
jgi:hypothetical protein